MLNSLGLALWQLGSLIHLDFGFSASLHQRVEGESLALGQISCRCVLFIGCKDAGSIPYAKGVSTVARLPYRKSAFGQHLT